MAYVALSKDLINRVSNKISGMRNREVSASCPNLSKEHTLDVHDLFHRGCWQEHLHLIDVIPKEWMYEQTRVDIYVEGEVRVSEDKAVKVRRSARFHGVTNAYAKPSRGGSYYGDTNSTLTIDQLRALPDDMLGKKILLQVYEDAVTEAEIKHKWDTVSHNVMEFLGKCKSLNEAIKLLPSIKMYVDKDDIERVERKIERNPRADLIEQEAADGITAAVVAARLMAGGV